MRSFGFLILACLLAACQNTVVEQKLVTPSQPQPTTLPRGTDVGNAGENFPDEHLAAWFVGDNGPVHACLEVAPDFGVDKKTARQTLRRAFDMWHDYIRSHDVHAEQDKSRRLILAVKIEDECRASTDIKFYFGIENPETQKARAQFINPTAFVQRLSFDRQIPRGKGIVWFARQGSVKASSGFPNWNREGRLLAAVLHEIGHVYGNDHVPGTIMDANISDRLEGNWSAEQLASIDHCRELSPCRDCDYWAPEVSKLPEALVHYFAQPLGHAVTKYDKGRIYRDDRGRFIALSFWSKEPKIYSQWALDLVSTKAVLSTGLPVFKVLHNSEVTSYVDQAFVQYATLIEVKWPPRELGLVAVEYNISQCSENRGDRSPVHLSVIDGKHQHEFGPFPNPVPFPED